MITLDEIKIIVKLTSGELGQNAMKAMITLDFGGVFKVKGFRILSSKYENEAGEQLWVVPPSYFAKGKYSPIFFSEDKVWWKSLEAKVLDAYHAATMDDVLADVKEE